MAGKAKYEVLSSMLQDAKLRKQVHNAATQQAAGRILKAAGARIGVKFTDPWLKEALDDVVLTRRPFGLSTGDLMRLAGAAAEDSAPKLCHTDSCGGGHKGCCLTVSTLYRRPHSVAADSSVLPERPSRVLHFLLGEHGREVVLCGQQRGHILQ